MHHTMKSNFMLQKSQRLDKKSRDFQDFPKGIAENKVRFAMWIIDAVKIYIVPLIYG